MLENGWADEAICQVVVLVLQRYLESCFCVVKHLKQHNI